MTSASIFLQIIFNGIMLGIQYSLVAVGFSLFFGVLDVINFAHGDIFMLGAFVSLILINVTGMLTASGATYVFLLILVIILSMIIVGGLGVFFERIVVKPVSKGPTLMSLVATLGLGIAIREAVRLFYPRGSETKRFPELLVKLFPGKEAIEFKGIILRYDNLLILAVGVIVVILLALYINKTKMGLTIRAVAQDAEAASMMGVNKNLIIDVTFFIGSALAALAGFMNGLYYNSIIFDMGAMAGIVGFSAAVIGGLGNIYGAIVGGFLFAMVESLSAALIPKGSEYMTVIAFAVVILFLIFRPSGILGERAYERV
ncbi:MAG: branched-chain amino acid ABC transporter permease [Caldiserica bacterium]|nr:MAG: branched-chain amino acid ABC transporter permease [Caldisericota bacterium]RLD16956.1 MAG: branched-chain amino acid ABC transporter permease [Caldisericota bacterium]